MIPGGQAPADSFSTCMMALGKAVNVTQKLKAANDTMFVQATRRMSAMDEGLTVARAKLFIDFSLVTVVVIAAVVFLLWKGRKVQRHYEKLLQFANWSPQKIDELQKSVLERDAKCLDYDADYTSDFQSLDVDLSNRKSQWPKWSPWSFIVLLAALWVTILLVTF